MQTYPEYSDLNVRQPPNIENVRSHSRATVERLRTLLMARVKARADANRRGFFEITDDDLVFYIHVSPVNGKVLLLATWASEAPPERVCETPAEALV